MLGLLTKGIISGGVGGGVIVQGGGSGGAEDPPWAIDIHRAAVEKEDDFRIKVTKVEVDS